jgi:hypothetical protein
MSRSLKLAVRLTVVLAILLGVLITPGPAAASSQAAESFESFSNTFINQDGTPDFQAGSHPWAMVTSFTFRKDLDGYVKDIQFDLPPGLVGDPGAVASCSIQQFTTKPPPGARSGPAEEDCPTDSQIGVAEVKATVKGQVGGSSNFYNLGLYNLTPPPGVPAELGFNVTGLPVILRASVRTGEDNGIRITVSNVSQEILVAGAKITLWGVPADHSHDGLRGVCLGPLGEEFAEPSHEPCPSSEVPTPYLTLPTSCSTTPPVARLRVDTWTEPGRFLEADPAPNLDGAGNPVGLVGCDALSFRPSIAIAPDTTKADTPAGLTAEVKVPQDGLTLEGGLAPATQQTTTVALPAGLVINPGQAAGLVACQPAQSAVGTEAAPSCPNASTVGVAEATTPLLADKLKGNVYILPSNPPNLQVLVALSGDGVNVKLVGDVHLNGATGQLTTTFSDLPQVPVTDFKLAFSGGAQAALATPTACGQYTAATDFTPWSAPFDADVLYSSAFLVETGPGGSRGECGALPFGPSMIAGATTDQAGGYTNFSLLLQRADGQQRVERLQFKTPAGLSGMISKVPLCPEPQASEGHCPAASQIGHTVVASGPGPYPLVVPEPGKLQAPIYLTGAYKGAPYGLSIVVPVEAGPFNLGSVVVRASIAVDPRTAQLTITTDALPQILDGVPTDLRTINAVIDRPDFMFNPTDCSPQAFTGTAYSTQGATAAISSRFQVGSCKSLAFKPGFKVSTQGRTSRQYGASLDAKVTYPPVPLGANQAAGEANIASVKVDLPKQLPSRLTTLQKACAAAQFEANPAGCPAASIIGHATAITPVLPVPLTGPAIFVSHGGEAFPSLEIVLQGYGVTVDLVAATFISHTGITSSTFKQVPDVPFSSFDLNLPEGPYSALAANGNLCAAKLAMPTAFTAQNGAVIKQNTKIAVTGCPRAKKAKKASNKPKAGQTSRVNTNRRAGR